MFFDKVFVAYFPDFLILFNELYKELMSIFGLVNIIDVEFKERNYCFNDVAVSCIFFVFFVACQQNLVQFLMELFDLFDVTKQKSFL